MPRTWKNIKIIKVTFLNLLLIILTSSCKVKQKGQSGKKLNNKQITANTCPENGKCSLEVFPESSLLVRNDKFGKTYTEIVKGDRLVIRYTYKKEPIQNTADSNYTENLIFEIPNDKINLHLQNKDLQKVKLTYERFCFCRDATGSFKITKGEMHISRKGNQLEFTLDFDAGKIPQKIKTVRETIDLN